ncbi:MAG: hypothetical protein ABIZ91_03295 [Gemmatimonadaceae bacterium]
MSVAFFVLLLTVTIAWVLAPVLPAIFELLRPTDAEPLDAVGSDSGDLTVFADGFRNYLARQLPAALQASPGAEYRGELQDGTPFLQVGERAEFLGESASDGAHSSRVVTTVPTTLPGGEVFMMELLARSTMQGGPDAIYRAVLAEQDLSLGERSSVLRWVHAAGNLYVGSGSTLFGRASALRDLRLGNDVSFTRVRAARVVTGSAEPPAPMLFPLVMQGTTKFPVGTTRERTFTRVAGDFTVPEGGAVTGSLVVTGTLTVEAGARIGGSVKTHGDCVLHDDVVIDGALISRRDVTTGRGCAIHGSLAAERTVVLGPGSSVGTPLAQASLAAERITLHDGVQVFGAVTAVREARTTSE